VRGDPLNNPVCELWSFRPAIINTALKMSEEDILVQILQDEQLDQFYVRLRDELQVFQPFPF